MSDEKNIWEPWTRKYVDCILGPEFEISAPGGHVVDRSGELVAIEGDPREAYAEIIGDHGRELGMVRSDEYPADVRFDVFVTVVPKKPPETKSK